MFFDQRFPLCPLCITFPPTKSPFILISLIFSCLCMCVQLHLIQVACMIMDWGLIACVAAMYQWLHYWGLLLPTSYNLLVICSVSGSNRDLWSLLPSIIKHWWVWSYTIWSYSHCCCEFFKAISRRAFYCMPYQPSFYHLLWHLLWASDGRSRCPN